MISQNMTNYLYIFIDVSGNYDFASSGTEHIVLTSIVCTEACSGVLELYRLKHLLIDQGVNIEYFHAAEDRQVVRDDVFSTIANLTNLRIDSVIVEKRKTAPKLRPLKIFYPRMIEYLLKYIFDPQGINVSNFDKVFIFLDREGSKASEREALAKVEAERQRQEQINRQKEIENQKQEQAARQREIEEYLSDGKRFFENGKYELCIEKMGEVVRRDSNNREAKQYIRMASKKIDDIKKQFSNPTFGESE